MRAVIALALAVVVLATVPSEELIKEEVKSFHDLFKQVNETLWLATVPKCSGTCSASCSGRSNCWCQISGHPGIVINSQTVSSSAFPCRSGSSATTFSFTLPSGQTYNGPTNGCRMTTAGTGAPGAKTVGYCNAGSPGDNLHIGAPCGSTGTFSGTGPSASCSAGLGGYTVDINCNSGVSHSYRILTCVNY